MIDMSLSHCIRALFCFGLLAISESSQAHHAPYIYDTENERVVTGTVTAFDWVQPHTWVTLSVANANEASETLLLEGMNPLFLGRRGWTRYSPRPGDVIEVAFFPRRDGSPEGMFLHAIFPDGSRKVMAVNPANSD